MQKLKLLVNAYDIQLYHSFDICDSNKALSDIRADLNNIFGIFQHHSLVLNSIKSVVQFFANDCDYRLMHEIFRLTVSVVEDPIVVEANNLNFVLDKRFKFNTQISKFKSSWTAV